MFGYEQMSLNLFPGETLLYSGPAKSAKIKNRALGSTRSHFGGSVRVASGVTLHSGGSTSQIIYGDTLLESPGTLFITNKRILINSQQYGFEINLENISTITQTFNPKGVAFTSGSKAYLILSKQSKDIASVLHEAAYVQSQAANMRSMRKQMEQLQTRERKQQKEEKRALRELNKQKAQEFNQRVNASFDCLSGAFRVHDRNYYEEELSKLRNLQYKRRPFELQPPDRDEIRSELEEKAYREITGFLFWEVNKKRQKHVSDHTDSIYEERYLSWNTSREQFENEEDAREEEFNRAVADDAAYMEKLLTGDPVFTSDSIETFLEQLNFQYPYDLDIIARTSDYAYVNLDLPEIEMLPRNEAVVNADGEIKYRPRSEKELRRIYLELVFGYALVIATAIFRGAPLLEEIVVSGYTQRRNPEGLIQNDYVFSVVFERSKMINTIDYRINAYKYCTLQFKSVFYVQSNGLLKKIMPLSVDISRLPKLQEVPEQLPQKEENTQQEQETNTKQIQSEEEFIVEETTAEEATAEETSVEQATEEEAHSEEDSTKEQADVEAVIITPVPFTFASLSKDEISPEDYIAASNKSEISKRALSIVEAEAPLLKDNLIRKVMGSFGVNKSAATLEATEKAIKSAKIRTTKQKGIVICWASDQDPKAYYGLRFSNERSGEEICLPELRNAVVYALQTKGELSKENLLKEASVALGYKRLGKNLEAVLTSGIQFARSSGSIVYVPGGTYKLP